MRVPRVVGIETEYGIVAHSGRPAGGERSAQADRYVDPMEASRILLSQLRGLGLVAVPHAEAAYPPPEIADDGALSEVSFVPTSGGPASAFFETDDWMLGNGARFYVDHAHPEYSTPECPTARALVAADKAGEVILDRCCRAALAGDALAPGQTLSLYKNNSDHKGNSYGCHENYLLSRELYEQLVYARPGLVASHLLPFFITRVCYCGAGKVGGENDTAPSGFQLSQRADFFETLVGIQTTYRRPLFNTRDEAHADASQYRRLHVIVGDANMAELSTYLKVGTMLILLRMLEDGFLTEDFALVDPVAEFQAVSRDTSFRRKLTLRNGKELSALEIQKKYLAAARRYLKKAGASEEERDIVARWSAVLDALESDWRQLASSLDWAIKRNLLERYLSAQGTTWKEVEQWETLVEQVIQAEMRIASEHGVAWEPEYTESPRWPAEVDRALRSAGLTAEDYPVQLQVYFGLRRLDLQYHDIRRGPSDEEAGLFYRLQRRNVIERIVSDEEITALIENPPEGTRAWVRGEFLKRFGEAVVRADWSYIHVAKATPGGAAESIYHLALPASDQAPHAAAGSLTQQYGAGGESSLERPPGGGKGYSNERNEKDSQVGAVKGQRAAGTVGAKKIARPRQPKQPRTTGHSRQRHRVGSGGGPKGAPSG
jgi:hypothetical protein